MKILVYGKTGQLAQALQDELETSWFLGRDQADFLVPDQCIDAINNIQPEIVINAAVYTAVDQAETERDQARQINALTPGLIADHCAAKEIPLVHYSTDYVYEGLGDQPLAESEPFNPLNHYGQTKLEGEMRIRNSGANHLIFRTSWLFSHCGRNFVKTMLRLGAEKETLAVVDDQIGSPTYAPFIAQATSQCLCPFLKHPDLFSGTYHLASQGCVSWKQFAEAIFSEWKALGGVFKTKEIKAIPSEDYPAPARRPGNSRLNCEKLKAVFGIEPPHWSDSLQICLRKIHESGNL